MNRGVDLSSPKRVQTNPLFCEVRTWIKQKRNGNYSPHSFDLTSHRGAADLALQFSLGLLPDGWARRRFSNCPYPCFAPGHIDLGRQRILRGVTRVVFFYARTAAPSCAIGPVIGSIPGCVMVASE
jgi:hypothetical protein